MNQTLYYFCFWLKTKIKNKKLSNHFGENKLFENCQDFRQEEGLGLGHEKI